MSITCTYISDTRTAEADVADVPPMYTPNGKRPIAPRRIRVSYDIASGRIWGFEIFGRKLFEDRSSGRGRINDTTIRRFISADLESAPQWVRDFVEEHRPIVPAVALAETGHEAPAVSEDQPTPRTCPVCQIIPGMEHWCLNDLTRLTSTEETEAR